jgi:hypothetical protein
LVLSFGKTSAEALQSARLSSQKGFLKQFIRLAVNLQTGRNLDTPDVVAKRYGNFIW